MTAMGTATMTHPSGGPRLAPISWTGVPGTGRGHLAAVTAGSGAGEDDELNPIGLAESKPCEIDEPTGRTNGPLPEIAGNEPDMVDDEAEALIPLRLLLVDDSQLFLGTLRRLLDTLSSIVVVGLAASGQEALELVDRLKPDVMLMDLAMPEMDGLEVTRRLAARAERPTIIMMSVHDLPTYRKATRKAGADAFVTKSDLVSQLEPLMRHLLNQFRSGGPRAS
jgi:CheY-like chemotaxis protein